MESNLIHSEHEPLSKSFNGEVGVISLTSWAKRIQNAGFTIYSIYKQFI